MDKLNLKDVRKPRSEGLEPRVIKGLGKVPFRSGDVVLHPREKADLEALGWKEGDPIPPDIGEKIAAARKQLAASHGEDWADEAVAGWPAGTKGLKKQPTPVPITQLPEDHQRRLRQFMDQAKNMDPSEWEVPENAHPSVLAALRVAKGAAQGTAEEPDLFGADPVISKLKEKAADPESGLRMSGVPKAKKPQGPPEAGDGPAAKPDPEIDRNDALNFVQSVLGNKPFKKSYGLFDGRLTLVFRTLPVGHGDMVMNQLTADQVAGKILSEPDLWRLYWDYRLCLALDVVGLNHGRTAETVEVGREVDEFLQDAFLGDGERTPLPGLLAKLQACQPLSNESVWRLAVSTYKKDFSGVVVTLEERALDPDFWQAIVG